MEDQIGAVIARMRKERSITLQTLAQRSGLTKGYLSKIENGHKSPPVSTLSRIAQALGVELSDFFDRPEIPPSFALVRKDERQSITRPGASSVYQYAAIAHSYGRKSMEPFIITFPPHSKSKTMMIHQGEEMLYVLKGRMRFVHGDKEYICEEGDCLYFDSSVPHRGECLGNEETQVLMVVSYRTESNHFPPANRSGRVRKKGGS
jgi:transcriptional regulator with XRE-family HTH domain